MFIDTSTIEAAMLHSIHSYKFFEIREYLKSFFVIDQSLEGVAFFSFIKLRATYIAFLWDGDVVHPCEIKEQRRVE